MNPRHTETWGTAGSDTAPPSTQPSATATIEDIKKLVAQISGEARSLANSTCGMGPEEAENTLKNPEMTIPVSLRQIREDLNDVLRDLAMTRKALGV